MIKRRHVLFFMLLAAALGLTFLKIPIASSQGVQVISAFVEGELPMNDPAAAAWQTAAAVEVPLSAQNVAKPFLLSSKIKSVAVRALQNRDQIAFLVEWADETEDSGSVAIQDFRDAAALQFPQVEGQPFFCMGQQGGSVNLWHWKADWQADLNARLEMEDQYPEMYVDDYPFAQAVEGKLASAADYIDKNYLPALQAGNLLAAAALTTPVEDLNAGGFGTLTAQPAAEQNVAGYGAWKDGVWQVIFSRNMETGDAEDITFQPYKTYSVAFAVWDGANEERNGQKSASQWVDLKMAVPPRAAAPAEATAPAQNPLSYLNIVTITVMVMILLLIIGAFIYYKLPE